MLPVLRLHSVSAVTRPVGRQGGRPAGLLRSLQQLISRPSLCTQDQPLPSRLPSPLPPPLPLRSLQQLISRPSLCTQDQPLPSLLGARPPRRSCPRSPRWRAGASGQSPRTSTLIAMRTNAVITPAGV